MQSPLPWGLVTLLLKIMSNKIVDVTVIASDHDIGGYEKNLPEGNCIKISQVSLSDISRSTARLRFPTAFSNTYRSHLSVRVAIAAVPGRRIATACALKLKPATVCDNFPEWRHSRATDPEY
ncbi:hypothetical protein [Neorhizobium sp. DT-125]|uniref:hypothetical protein n=1 Tax=Neorhizobium sp. DT-125 TaxID=3396163 RepID=UPI003F1CD9D2